MRYVIVLCVVLQGCATATPIRTGTGQSEYFIECNGEAVPWSKCFAKANESCPAGYDIVEQGTEHGPYTGTMIGSTATFGAALYKHLRVRCK